MDPWVLPFREAILFESKNYLVLKSQDNGIGIRFLLIR